MTVTTEAAGVRTGRGRSGTRCTGWHDRRVVEAAASRTAGAGAGCGRLHCPGLSRTPPPLGSDGPRRECRRPCGGPGEPARPRPARRGLGAVSARVTRVNTRCCVRAETAFPGWDTHGVSDA